MIVMLTEQKKVILYKTMNLVELNHKKIHLFVSFFLVITTQKHFKEKFSTVFSKSTLLEQVHSMNKFLLHIIYY